MYSNLMTYCDTVVWYSESMINVKDKHGAVACCFNLLLLWLKVLSLDADMAKSIQVSVLAGQR